jgi:hypothetical protein
MLFIKGKIKNSANVQNRGQLIRLCSDHKVIYYLVIKNDVTQLGKWLKQ